MRMPLGSKLRFSRRDYNRLKGHIVPNRRKPGSNSNRLSSLASGGHFFVDEPTNSRGGRAKGAAARLDFTIDANTLFRMQRRTRFSRRLHLIRIEKPGGKALNLRLNLMAAFTLIELLVV